MASRTSVFLDQESADRLAAITDHYSTAHGLRLTNSAVVRRCIASLHHELGLQGEPRVEDRKFLGDCFSLIQAKQPLEPAALDRFTRLALRFGGPLSIETLAQSAAVVEKLKADGALVAGPNGTLVFQGWDKTDER